MSARVLALVALVGIGSVLLSSCGGNDFACGDADCSETCGEGACRIDCHDNGTCDTNCLASESCSVDCHAADTCKTDCADASSCSVDCHNADSCVPSCNDTGTCAV